MIFAKQTHFPVAAIRFFAIAGFIAALGFITGCATTEQPVTEELPTIAEETVSLETAFVQAGPDLPPYPPFPAYPLNPTGAPEPLDSFLDESTLVSVQEDPWGGYVALLETSLNYYWEGKRVSTTYQIVFGGLDEVIAQPGPLAPGQELGIMGPNAYLTARTPSLDRSMVRSTEMYPLFFQDYWYFQPNWLEPNRMDHLLFRQNPNVLDATEDYYNRVALGDQAINGPGENFTLAHDPDQDMIRFILVIDELPVPADLTDALYETQMYYFGNPSVFTLQNIVQGNEYSVALYWLDGFDEYLAYEVDPGEPVWVYAYTYTMNHEENQVMVFVRDFSPFSDEEVIDFRIEEIRQEFPDLEVAFPRLP